MHCTGDVLLFLFKFVTLDITCEMQNSEVSQRVTIQVLQYLQKNMQSKNVNKT